VLSSATRAPERQIGLISRENVMAAHPLLMLHSQPYYRIARPRKLWF